jgi:hypothetical protein
VNCLCILLDKNKKRFMPGTGTPAFNNKVLYNAEGPVSRPLVSSTAIAAPAVPMAPQAAAAEVG